MVWELNYLGGNQSTSIRKFNVSEHIIIHSQASFKAFIGRRLKYKSISITPKQTPYQAEFIFHQVFAKTKSNICLVYHLVCSYLLQEDRLLNPCYRQLVFTCVLLNVIVFQRTILCDLLKTALRSRFNCCD